MDDRLEKIESKLDDIGEAVTELRSMWPHLCRRVEKLEHEIYGENGKLGLVSRLQTVYIIAAWVAAATGTAVGGALFYMIGR